MSVQVKNSSSIANQRDIITKNQIIIQNRLYQGSNQKEQKNATQNRQINHQQGAKQKAINGFMKIINKFNIIDSLVNFTADLKNYNIQKEEQLDHKTSPQQQQSRVVQKNDEKWAKQQLEKPQTDFVQSLNKTPFFSLVQQPAERNQSMYLIFQNVLQRIIGKNNQALQQIKTNFWQNKKPYQLASGILQRIISKSSQAFQQISSNISHQFLKQEHFREYKSKSIQDANQFISQSFGSEQKLQEVKKYVHELKNNQIENYIRQSQNRIKNMNKFVELVQKFINKGLQQISIEAMKRWKIKTPLSSSPNMRDSQNAALSQKISSAQSQRLKSGVSKYSEHDDSFNLDLTVKTKNSKNPFQYGKMDSLMYSADSGFGLKMSQSPNKERKADEHSNSSKSVNQKYQDMVNQSREGKRSNLIKSYSQKATIQKQENNLKRQLTAKQKIDEDYQVEIDNDNDQQNNDKKQLNEFQNLQKSDATAQFAIQQNQSNLRANNQKNYQSEILKNKLNVKKKEQIKERSLDGKSSKKLKHNNKKRHTEQKYDQNSSIKQDTIVNKLQNFDADDEDQNFKEKQLHQSVNFNKNNSTQQLIKKRVETEAGKNKRQLKKQQSNYSIKNIKRFNKIDISKYQQINTSQKNSRIISNSGSQANIFSTQINNYNLKISKLKQQKQLKKKLLQKQLARINYEIKIIHQKQEQMSPQSNNYYPSRVKISDNLDAQKKAESLVKNLRSQKRNRNIAKIGQFSSLDKNINEYMEQLTKLRTQNEQKTKQRKKLQILQRMKQNQMRKINEKKKISQNQQFVLHLKGSNNNNKVDAFKSDLPSKRTPTRNQEEPIVPSPKLEVITPQLNQKKAYLNKIRSFSMKKKQQMDIYEQALD